MAVKHLVGDHITYKQNGICEIKSITRQDFGIMGGREYYELVPVYENKTVIFVPTDSEKLTAEMRHVLSKDEIDVIICRSDAEDHVWKTDAKERASEMEEILESGDRARILWVIKVLSLYKKQLEAVKKKMYASDERVLSTAQKIITEEFSFVLGIEKEQVVPYILEKLGK